VTASVTYLLPIRRDETPAPRELTRYLRWMSDWAIVLVVDGSPPDIFAKHRREWGSFAIHEAPRPALRSLNGKAWGVRTGMQLVESEIVVIADDDVRYSSRSLAAAVDAMDDTDLLRPQNVFNPMPWHATWDTGRTLLNRALGTDHPGTLVIRRSVYAALGGYDGDVLFENLELVRTFRVAGARVVDRPDLYVERLPPTVERFWSQRVRQAYDDLAQPWRFARHLAVVPTVALLAQRPRQLLVAAAGVVTLAEIGRRRAGGRSVFGVQAGLLSLAWVLERGVCSWVALAWRLLRGGCPYAGSTFVRAATPVRELRLRVGAGNGPSGGNRPSGVRPVAERGESAPAASTE
jgi:hypothetical protein